VGFKASGGIRTVADASAYIALVEHHLGAAALTPERFRIGASSLLGDIERALRETRQIVDSGAQEVDVVMPFERLLAGDEFGVAALLAAVRKACRGLRLKVILETGVLAEAKHIVRACELSLAEGADFLKTSTGKTPVSATPEAARLMLEAIAADPKAAARVGFKASGGIRNVADASVYIALVERHLGAAALTPERFRIGASSLLCDIEAVLGGTGSAPPPAGSY